MNSYSISETSLITLKSALVYFSQLYDRLIARFSSNPPPLLGLAYQHALYYLVERLWSALTLLAAWLAGRSGLDCETRITLSAAAEI